MQDNFSRSDTLRGLRDGLPIGLGYFAVAFSLGITAKSAGLSPFQGFIASFLNHASAGEYALFTLIGENAAFFEVALVIFITNMRYLLMSAALSQRLSPETTMLHRVLVGFGITDEIFGLGIAEKGHISVRYILTAFLLADLMWSGGTFCGIVAGSVLPAAFVSALGVAIYGMFLAIIIPPARKNRVILALIAVSFALSFVFSVAPLLSGLSSGTKTMVLTISISAAAALLFPVKEEEGAHS